MIVRTARDYLQRLLTQPGEELSAWARFVRYQVRLWRFCARQLREHNLLALAAALSFQTIFAIVPALVLTFLFARALGFVENTQSGFRTVLDTAGLAQIMIVQDTPPDATQPAAAGRTINVADELEKLIRDVENKLTFNRVGPIGAALLIVSALALLKTIEESLNRIFGAVRNRSITRRVLLYWSVLTLGPVGIALAAYLGRQAIVSVQDTPQIAWFVALIGWAGPTLVGILVLTGVYVLMPNTRVNYQAAVGGATVAVLLWLLARWAFALYVRHFVVKGNLYGILGLVPLFLLWLNLSWTIFLFGAELAHTAANLARMEAAAAARNRPPRATDALSVALAVAQPFQSGTGPVAFGQIAAALGLPEDVVRPLLERLIARRIVCNVDGAIDTYVLARPPERITVAEMLELDAPEPAHVPLRAPIDAVEDRLSGSIAALTLADVLTDGAAGAANVPPPRS